MTLILTCTCCILRYQHAWSSVLEIHPVILTTTALQTPFCYLHPSTALSFLNLPPRPSSSSPPPRLAPAYRTFPWPRQ
jgi:hypothetical protein